MKILIATEHQLVIGGIETYLRALLPALRDAGHEVGVLYEHQAMPGQPLVDAAAVGLPAWFGGEAATLERVAAWRPDVACVQGLADPCLEQALTRRFPAVLYAHAYHGTCVSGTKRHAFPVPHPCNRRLGLACLVLYYPCRCGGLNPVTMLRLYRRQSERRRLLASYRRVLVASRHMRDEYLKNGVAAERLELVPLFPPGQTPDPEMPAPRPRRDEVLMVGRLNDLKGGRLLVEAMARACRELGRPLQLVVAGEGPEGGAMELLAGRWGVAAQMVGWVDEKRRTELMRQADVLAVPSVWPEPFGLIGVEAGCVGLPAVAFSVGGIPDWLRPGESGELAPGSRPTAAGLASALVRALADPARLARLGQGALRVAQEFTLAAHVSRLEAVLRRAADELPPAQLETFPFSSATKECEP